MNNKNILNHKKEIQSDNINWDVIQLEMKNKLGHDIYESWLRKLSFVEEFNDYVLLSVSTRFIRDWITSRYLDQILQIIKNHKKRINRIELKIFEKNDENLTESLEEQKTSTKSIYTKCKFFLKLSTIYRLIFFFIFYHKKFSPLDFI